MPECHWTANQIVEKINGNDLKAASGMLQSEMTKMSVSDFKSLVDSMVNLTKDDGNDSNDVQFELNSNNEIISVSINDGYLWDTQLARKGVPSPNRLLGALNYDCNINQ